MALSLTLSPAVRRRFDRLAADAARVLGPELVAVVATGDNTSVVFSTVLSARHLDAFSALVDTWHNEGLDTPLFLTPEEFRRSLDTFPIEYQTVLDRHVVIAGTPPFEGVSVPPDQLRRACEVQAKGHLIHLREGWLEARGHDGALAALIVRSSAPLRVLLTNVARLFQHTPHANETAATGAALAELPADLIRDVLALDAAPELGIRLVPRLAEYLAAAERLWAFVDGWRSEHER